jgi:hypothetical protein
MNTINMPGFIAEASVYTTRNHYRLATGQTGGIVAPVDSELIPQLRKVDWECVAEHREAGFDMDMSAFFCEERGGSEGGGDRETGGGGRPLRCMPDCSECGPSSDGRPGLWKSCTKSNCTDHEVRC